MLNAPALLFGMLQLKHAALMQLAHVLPAKPFGIQRPQLVVQVQQVNVLAILFGILLPINVVLIQPDNAPARIIGIQ